MYCSELDLNKETIDITQTQQTPIVSPLLPLVVSESEDWTDPIPIGHLIKLRLD